MKPKHAEFLGDAGQMIVWAFVLVVAGKVYLGAGSQAALSFVSFVAIGYLLGRQSKFKKMVGLHDKIVEAQDQMISMLESRLDRKETEIQNLLVVVARAPENKP